MLAQIAKASVALLPDSAAFLLTRFLAARPQRLGLKERDRGALASGRRYTFGWRNRKPAWSWGEGPIVLCLHGWAGRGAQMAPLAQSLAQRGYQAWVFDVSRHGDAKASTADLSDFIEDLVELIRFMDRPVHAIVGHSAAGMAMMAARRHHRLQIPYYVHLCTPYYPYVPIDTIRRRLDPSPAVITRCEAYYAAQFGVAWERLRQGWLYQEGGAEQLLLFFDHDDDQVHHSDSELILTHRPEAKVIKTHGLGHHKLLWNADVLTQVADFLQPNQQTTTAEHPTVAMAKRASIAS